MGTVGEMIDPSERVLDWRPNHDPRSLAPEHRVFAAHLPVFDGALPLSKHYRPVRPVLDQGREGACVGHGVTNVLRHHPRVRLRVLDAQQLAFGMYYGSRRIDEWPGEDYDGTSVNAGMKLARELGLLVSWRWCVGAGEVRDALLLGQGPVAIGIPWSESMYVTGPHGLVTVTGAQVGGHCLMVDGYSRRATHDGVSGPFFRWQNSWGPSYGVGGYGFVPFDTMVQLLAEIGEAAVVVG